MSSDREPQDEVTLRLYMADAIEADLIEAVEEVMKDDPSRSASERRDIVDFNIDLASIAIIIALITYCL